MRSPRVQVSRRRIGIARVMMLSIFVVLGFRAAYLSIDERGRQRGDDQTMRTLKRPPARGSIVDHTRAIGRVLHGVSLEFEVHLGY